MLVLFPARTAINLAPLPKGVEVIGVTGSLWSGQAEQIVLPHRQLSNVSWTLEPWLILLGKLQLNLVIGEPSSTINGKGLVTVSWAGVEINNVKFEAPTQFLLAGTSLPFKTQLVGELSFLLPTFVQGEPWCEQLTGKVFANNIELSNQFGHYPLGELTLALACQEGDILITSDESMNQLGFNGSLKVKQHNHIEIDAKIRETDSQPKELQKALVFLGQKDSQGYYPLFYSGSIPKL